MSNFSDPIFRGCTRPAMLFGVPMLPFCSVTGVAILLAGWSFYLLSAYVTLFIAAIYVPIYFWMRAITKVDDQRLKQVLMRWRIRGETDPEPSKMGSNLFSPA